MAKGIKTGGGSRKGVPNKNTTELKAMISGALQDVGGRDYLARQAEENPTAFMGMLGKILPKEVKQEISGSIGVTVEPEVVISALERKYAKSDG